MMIEEFPTSFTLKGFLSNMHAHMSSKDCVMDFPDSSYFIEFLSTMNLFVQLKKTTST